MTKLPNDRISFELEYMYRDGGNYKFFGHVLLDDSIDITQLNETMIDRCYFLPMEVGLESLVPSPRNSDDHDLHEVIGINETVSNGPRTSSAELVRRFALASSKGWYNVR